MLKNNLLGVKYKLSFCRVLTLKRILKLSLCLISLLIVNNVSAKIILSATSNQVIQGHNPYLTFDGGLTKSDDVESLLSIIIPGGQKITPSNDTSSLSQPIGVAEGIKFADIQTNVPLHSTNNSYPDYPLSNIIINSNYWGDVDGDASPKVTGTLQVKWIDSDGNNITFKVQQNENDPLEGCAGPYQLTISNTDGTLSTQYGIPHELNFKANKHTYYIFSGIKKFCYAKPNRLAEDDRWNNIKIKNGPDWTREKGFNTYDPNHPEKNFPTTGSNNLFFDLKIAGLTAEEIIANNGRNINPESGSGVNLVLSDNNGVLRVTLKGPSSASNGGDFSPSTFKLYKDSGKTDYFYTFIIQRWYIPIPGPQGGYQNGVTKCASLNGDYRVPDVLDYTNSPGGSGTGYTRTISNKDSEGKWNGGIFNEWGTTTTEYFTDSDWDDYLDDYDHRPLYWTSKVWNSGAQYTVESKWGRFSMWSTTKADIRVACVTP